MDSPELGCLAGEPRTCAEAIGVREIGRRGKANGSILVVLSDEVTAESVVDHASTGAECADFPNSFPMIPLRPCGPYARPKRGAKIQVTGVSTMFGLPFTGPFKSQFRMLCGIAFCGTPWL